MLEDSGRCSFILACIKGCCCAREMERSDKEWMCVSTAGGKSDNGDPSSRRPLTFQASDSEDFEFLQRNFHIRGPVIAENTQLASLGRPIFDCLQV